MTRFLPRFCLLVVDLAALLAVCGGRVQAGAGAPRDISITQLGQVP